MYLTLMFTLLAFALQNGQEFYQQAMVQEHAAGNLEAAIQLYQDAARYSGGNRDLEAHALIGAARCYEKLGQAKAREIYEEVARTYSDLKPHAAIARDRVAALQPNKSAFFVHESGANGENAVVVGGIRLKAEEIKLINVGPGMFWTSNNEAFEPGRPITITGTVRSMHFTNFGTFLGVAVKQPDGSVTTYKVIGGSPNTVFRNGFTRQSVRPGDEVTIEGIESRDPSALTIGLATITLADGRRVFLGESSGQ
jgi:hypothetical protein